jgi:hypothetical protein
MSNSTLLCTIFVIKLISIRSDADPKKSEKRKRRDSGDDEEEDETFSAGDVDRENKRRDLSSKVKSLSKKRKGGSKNNAAIEALEIATEQTLKVGGPSNAS